MQLTQEQVAALKALRKSYFKKQIKSAFALIFYVILSSLIIAFVDALWVNNEMFRFFGCLSTGVFLGVSASNQSRENFKAFVEEYQKIVK